MLLNLSNNMVTWFPTELVRYQCKISKRLSIPYNSMPPIYFIICFKMPNGDLNTDFLMCRVSLCMRLSCLPVYICALRWICFIYQKFMHPFNQLELWLVVSMFIACFNARYVMFNGCSTSTVWATFIFLRIIHCVDSNNVTWCFNTQPLVP